MKYPFANFRNNLRNLRVAHKKDKVSAAFDQLAYDHDQQLFGQPPEMTRWGYPRWPDSEAARLMNERDFDLVMNKEKTVKQLRDENDAYKQFPLKVLQKHFHQKWRKTVETPYWAKKKADKQRKKYGTA